MKRNIYLALYVLIFTVSFLLLASGSSLLEQPLFFAKSVPFGTISTWAGIIALPCIILYAIPAFHPPHTRFIRTYRLGLQLIILLSSSWGIVSFLLAGNLAFNFSGQADSFQGSPEAYIVFIRYTYFLAVLPVAFLIVFGLHILIRKLING